MENKIIEEKIILQKKTEGKGMNIVEKLLSIDTGKLIRPKRTVKMQLAKLGGTELEFECKSVDPERIAEIQNDSYTIKKGQLKEIDTYKMRTEVIFDACPEVFKNKNILDHFDAPTPPELIKRIMLPGEIDDLYKVCNEVNGYQDEEEDEKEIKK